MNPADYRFVEIGEDYYWAFGRHYLVDAMTDDLHITRDVHNRLFAVQSVVINDIPRLAYYQLVPTTKEEEDDSRSVA